MLIQIAYHKLKVDQKILGQAWLEIGQASLDRGL